MPKKTKKRKYSELVNKLIPGLVGGLVVTVLFVLFLTVNNNAFGKALFGTKDSEIVEEKTEEFVPSTSPQFVIISSPSPSLIPPPSPSFSPLPLVVVPKNDLQARKDAFNEKVKAFIEKAKAEGASNTAIANTIRFQYQLEFGTNANSQQEYSNCLINYNTKLAEYNACMLSENYGCYQPVNSCFKPLDAGF